MRLPRPLLFAPFVLAACAEAPPPAPQAPTQAPTTTAAPEAPKAPETKAAKPPEPTSGATAPPLATVLADAKAKGTVPLLVFSTVWCAPCEMVERDVLPKPEVIKALAPYRLQKYDAEIGEGIAAAQKYGVSSYPTMIFLGADGEEVARAGAPQHPEPFIELITTKLPLARAGKAPEKSNEKEGDALASNDPKKVLTAAQAEDQRPDPKKAAKLYAAAAALATKQKQADVAAEASFGLLQVEARERDRKEHAGLLLAFVKAHAPAPKSLDALEGLAGVATDAVKLSDVKASVTKLETAFVEAHKDAELRRLAAVMKKMGDEGGAKRLEELAAKEGTNRPSTPEAFRFADPLGTKFTFSVGNKPVSAQQGFPMTTSRQLVEDCRHLPRPSEPPIVRVHVANGVVTRAVTLDPELPADLRSCLEASAVKIKNVPAGVPEKTEVRVTYGPKAPTP